MSSPHDDDVSLLHTLLSAAADHGRSHYTDVDCPVCFVTPPDPCTHWQRVADAQLYYQSRALVAQVTPPPDAPASLADTAKCDSTITLDSRTIECIVNSFKHPRHSTHVGIRHSLYMGWWTSRCSDTEPHRIWVDMDYTPDPDDLD